MNVIWTVFLLAPELEGWLLFKSNGDVNNGMENVRKRNATMSSIPDLLCLKFRLIAKLVRRKGEKNALGGKDPKDETLGKPNLFIFFKNVNKL